MEAKKTKNLSARLRSVKPPSTSFTSASTVSEVKSSCSSSSRKKVLQSCCSSSDSDSDDFATVHFKLAAALEAAAAHASGLRFDWQSMKNALMSDATSSAGKSKGTSLAVANVKEHAMEKTPAAVSEQDTEVLAPSHSTSGHKESNVEQHMKQASVVASKENPMFVSFNPTSAGYESSSGSSISSDEDDDDVSNILLPLFSKPLAAMQFSKLTSFAGIAGGNVEGTTSVLDDATPLAALAKILDRMPFNPFDADLVQVQFVFKSIVSLTQLSLRENNVIEVEIKKSSIVEFSKSKKDRALSPFMDVSNINVQHSNDEFFTFCSCAKCLEYREIVFHIMVDQFKAAHMVVMLLDVLIKAYGPMLKNVTAYNKFEKLLDANKEIYWITCGFIYSKKAEHLDFIYDESLSDNMILVLFSSILMANNPILLLQILAFHVECIVKAYAEGFMEIVEPDKSQPNKTPAEEMLTYILDGYDDLCRISDHISSYLYAFENDFLHRVSLTWNLLCQRLYQQHVYMNLTDTMLGCIITLKEDELTTRHAALIKKYIQFDDKMNYVDRCWTKAWIELNKVNLAEKERKRRKCLLDVYHIFDTVVQDAIAFSLQESGDDNDFYDFQSLEDRRLAWQNIMAYTKMKWPDGFFQQPNMLVCDDKCKKCFASLEYHQENCKCITCSIAGGPLPPKRNSDSTCYKCLAHSLVDKEMNLYESKILNVCASDDFLSFVKSNRKRKTTTLEELGEEVCATLSVEDKCSETHVESDGIYHISWAVYKHLSSRKRYRHTTLEERFFCQDCALPACLLARKILNNEISRELSVLLIHYYQPFVMNREDLRAILPNIMLYNRKMIGSNIVRPVTDMHDFIVKNYWTFIISLYATYFVDLDEKCPLNLNYFDVSHNDIGFRIDYKTLSIGIHGDKEDRQFLEFLDKIKSLSPYKNELVSEIDFAVDVHTEEFQNKLDNFLHLYEKHRNCATNDKVPRLTNAAAESGTAPVDPHSKKTCKERSKKCCFDHPDLGEHCKDSHTGKKRMKKECNHARMNETRDRLRKKLSQLVNARKNIKGAGGAAGVAANLPSTYMQSSVKQPPTLKSAATAAAAHTSTTISTKVDDEDDSLECLNSLCKRISHLHTCKGSASGGGASSAPQQAASKKQNATDSGSPTAKQLNGSNDLAKDSVGSIVSELTSSTNDTNNTNNNNNIVPTYSKRINGADASAAVANANATTNSNINTSTSAKSKEDSSWDVASEIYEFIDNYSKDQSKVKKWINETLSYIEGSGSAGGNGKKQPQPTNPKKAAKKAKQKQRKEEEKRIAELHDLRGQFHDIYFKEFADKLDLKTLKASKKRDKRKIAELEANVKKLQRAKGKVETGILELIATVKQTNTEFKFAYLPTKEQQLAKLKELEMLGSDAAAPDVAVFQTPSSPATQPTHGVAQSLATALPTPAAGSYALPYAHANHFPYHPPHPLDFPGAAAAVAGATAYGMIRPPLPTPMCYAPPPQQQQFSPDVVVARASNIACNPNTDPSKRIVTIRRVNLPNVPEPQVTVTAKGSSPDKDKLLYTFVNGQLVQTGAATSAPPPMTQLPRPHVVSNSTPSAPLISIPLPPRSKTQMKKERRRLAKLLAEEAQAAAAVAAEQLQLAEEAALQQRLRNSEASAKGQRSGKETLANNNKKKLNKQKCAEAKQGGPQQKVEDLPAGNLKQKQLLSQAQAQEQKHVAANAACARDAPPASNAVPQSKAKKKTAVASARRSASTTTSCSVGTGASSATATPVSSEVNTRDNSVCSLQPAAGGAVKVPVAVTSASAKKNKPPQDVKKQQKPQQVQKQQQQPQMRSATPETKTQLTPLYGSSSTSSNPRPVAAVEPNVPLALPQRRRIKRGKNLDNGQFDNNPFKSLHMQDSETDSEWGSASSYVEEEVPEGQQPKVLKVYKKESEQQQHQQKRLEPPQKPAQETFKTRQLVAKTTQPRKEECPSVVQGKRLPRETPTERPKKTSMQQQSAQRRSKAKVEMQPAQTTPRATASSRSKPSGQAAEPPKTRSSFRPQTKKPDMPPPPHRLSHQQTQVNNSRAEGREGRNGAACNRRNGANRGQGGAAGVSAGVSGPSSHNPQVQTSRTGSSRRGNRHAAPDGAAQASAASGKPLSKRAQKQALRNKKFQSHQQAKQLQHHHNQYASHHDDYCAGGIPSHMGYFNANDVALPQPAATQARQYQAQQQQQHYGGLAQQMQGLCLGNSGQQPGAAAAAPSYASVSNSYASKSLSANVSIMDQLNRGVQVENLSLPPGITLTKVDPAKSEQLRQKSESIKKLSKPLQSQSAAQQTTFHHHPGATIIAPPVASASYYGAPYAGVAAAAMDHHNQSGIIMVEANLPPTSINGKTAHGRSQMAVAAAAAAAKNSKTTKNKKRRGKAKSDGGGRSSNAAARAASQPSDDGNQPEMITLRNPMFHGGPMGAAATILQQPGLIPARPLGGLPLPTSLPMDQPAAIIKNENGMFTIRNPALHQAVTNGLALGGYRQFGNVNYYTPQEAAAEAARATQLQQTAEAATGVSARAASFSYFSSSSSASDATGASTTGVGAIGNSGHGHVAATHNTISISCTSIDDQSGSTGGSGGGLVGDAAVIARPTPQQKCISAIGSEIKSAQQQKQKCKESQQSWTNFGPELAASMAPLTASGADELTCGAESATSFLGAAGSGAGGLTNTALQEQYQQSSYYNGFNVFPAKSSSSQISSAGGRSSNTGSLFDGADCHMHHSCGDDSPPPTITGYQSYLEGIPNTGVIRYDDASFLKNLIPGQNLNNEVSIHNVNDSNFTRNSASPVAHRVEITPIYTNRPTSANMYVQCSSVPGAPLQHAASVSQQQQVFVANAACNYRENLTDYGTDPNMFVSNNLLHLSELADTGEQQPEAFKPFNYEFESTTEKQKLILDLNDLLLKKSGHSQRTSPYLDESTLESFVQNMNTLQISTPSDEQCSQLNGGGGGSADGGSSNSANGNGGGCGSNCSGGANSSTANGWW